MFSQLLSNFIGGVLINLIIDISLLTIYNYLPLIGIIGYIIYGYLLLDALYLSKGNILALSTFFGIFITFILIHFFL
jgi:hypothetical protein